MPIIGSLSVLISLWWRHDHGTRVFDLKNGIVGNFGTLEQSLSWNLHKDDVLLIVFSSRSVDPTCHWGLNWLFLVGKYILKSEKKKPRMLLNVLIFWLNLKWKCKFQIHNATYGGHPKSSEITPRIFPAKVAPTTICVIH